MKRSFLLSMLFYWIVSASSLFAQAPNKHSKGKAEVFIEEEVKIEGVDNMLVHKAAVAPTYDQFPPILNAEACDLEAKFNLKIKGKTVEFKDRSKGEYTNIEWVFGDGFMSHQPAVKHTYDKGGLYYFSVTLYNAKTGCVDFFAGNYFLSDIKSKP